MRGFILAFANIKPRPPDEYVTSILAYRTRIRQYLFSRIDFWTWHDSCIPWISAHTPGLLSIGRSTYIRNWWFC